MGELHLEVIVDRMLREFRVQANVGRPQVAYRETIRKAGRGRVASCARPAARASTAMLVSSRAAASAGCGFEFEKKIVGGSVPREYFVPIEAGPGSASKAASSPATR